MIVLVWLALLWRSLALATDAPVITISREAMGPQQIEIHVGEQVRWRTPTGERLRIEFDAHRDAHEVVVRQGEVQAVFLGEGVHWYTGSVARDGESCSAESSWSRCQRPRWTGRRPAVRRARTGYASGRDGVEPVQERGG
jgi:hypothetical protein